MVAAAAASSPVKQELDWFARLWNPPRLRSSLDFAIDELVIPEGETKNERFRVHTQPWNRLLLREMDNPHWYNIVVVGCVQSGKSLFGFILPLLYFLFEYCETVILGVPTVDEIGRDKWSTEVLPVIRSSGFSYLLPTKGLGSKGGFPKEVHFQNGARLKIMGGTGGDEKRSSYTARVVVITEVDKMDEASENSREADPVSQMAARSMRWDIADRRLFMECTVSHTRGRIWQEYIKGSTSRIACPCPYCGAYVTPERDSLRGWQEAADVLAAEQDAYFVCPECEHVLTADDRRIMNREAVLVHRGQSIDTAGKITGDLPATRTLGFRWNAFNNMFWSAGAIGVAEWRAERAENEESAERETAQFYWATPWDPPQVDLAPIDPEKARKRFGGSRQGFVPADTQALTLGVDMGKWVGWWHLTASQPDGSPHVVDHGEFAVPSKSMSVETAMITALKEFRDETVLEGWPLPGGELLVPQQVWIDSKYKPEAVKAFCRESGERFRPTEGQGYGQHYTQSYSQPNKTSLIIRFVGEQYHIDWDKTAGVHIARINADYWKSFWHERIVTPVGEPGALTLYHSTKDSEHRDLIRHYTSERQFEEFIPGLGTVIRWERIRKKNHKLDCAYMAAAAAHFCGVRVVKTPVVAKKRPEKSKPFLTPYGEPYLISDRKDS